MLESLECLWSWIPYIHTNFICQLSEVYGIVLIAKLIYCYPADSVYWTPFFTHNICKLRCNVSLMTYMHLQYNTSHYFWTWIFFSSFVDYIISFAHEWVTAGTASQRLIRSHHLVGDCPPVLCFPTFLDIMTFYRFSYCRHVIWTRWKTYSCICCWSMNLLMYRIIEKMRV